jgi:hypothetical protein
MVATKTLLLARHCEKERKRLCLLNDLSRYMSTCKGIYTYYTTSLVHYHLSGKVNAISSAAVEKTRVVLRVPSCDVGAQAKLSQAEPHGNY